jgi:hypothetical protein
MPWCGLTLAEDLAWTEAALRLIGLQGELLGRALAFEAVKQLGSHSFEHNCVAFDGLQWNGPKDRLHAVPALIMRVRGR